MNRKRFKIIVLVIYGTLLRPIKAFTTMNGRAANKFTFGDVIGEGDFSKVRKVIYKKNQTAYTLKGCVLENNETLVELQLREAQTMSKIADSNNILQVMVRCYDAWIEEMTEDVAKAFFDNDPKLIEKSDNGSTKKTFVLFTQLEFCEYSLKTWIKEGNLRRDYEKYHEEKCDIFEKVLEALRHIHSRGMVHEDIKPENILIFVDKDGDKDVKIVGVGLSKFKRNSPLRSQAVNYITKYDELGKAPAFGMTKMMESLLYNAPEQLLRSPEGPAPNYSSKIDMYAVGILLFEIFSNFRSRSERLRAVLKLRKHRKCTFRDDMPRAGRILYPEAADLVERLLHKDPSMRPTALKILVENHKTIAARRERQAARREMVKLTPADPSDPTPLSSSLHFLVYLMVAVLICVGLIYLIWYFCCKKDDVKRPSSEDPHDVSVSSSLTPGSSPDVSILLNSLISKGKICTDPETGSPFVQHDVIDHRQWYSLKKLGSGSFGTVYLALNEVNGSLFAVKQFGTDQSASWELQKEVSLLSKLEHANIVKYLGSSVKHDEFMLYLEYVAGGTLAGILKTGPIPASTTKLYLSQILSGLQYLHANNVIHRDLKPSNILISAAGQLKLADFGTAFDLSKLSQTRDQTFCGTPAFASPEVIRKEAHTTKSDIWTLGVVAFVMLTADLPWQSRDVYQVILTIANGKVRPVYPAGMDMVLMRFIDLCMQGEAWLRPSASELLERGFGPSEIYSLEPVAITIGQEVTERFPFRANSNELSHSIEPGSSVPLSSWCSSPLLVSDSELSCGNTSCHKSSSPSGAKEDLGYGHELM